MSKQQERTINQLVDILQSSNKDYNRLVKALRRIQKEIDKPLGTKN